MEWNTVYILIYSVIYLLVVAVATGVITVVERRVAGRMQSRVGPNRVGPQGTLQWLADGLKGIQKEDIITRDTNVALFKMAPYFVFMGMFATWVAIPLGVTTVMADLNVGIFYILAATSLIVLGLVMAGWSSNNKWSLLGGMRSAAQLISYEIPTAVSVFIIILMVGSLSMQDIIKAQGPHFWDWFLFRNPFAFITFFIFFISSLAEGNRVPFDIPEAESELVSGYNTEYSGMRFIFFFFAEYANLFVMGALITTLFLGGWQIWDWAKIPVHFSLPGLALPVYIELGGIIWYLIKVNIIVFIIIQLRWTLPRLRVDQLMNVCWKYLVPIGFISSIGVLFWMYFIPQGSTGDYLTRYIMFGIGVIIMALFFYKVIKNIITMKQKVHLNPFI